MGIWCSSTERWDVYFPSYQFQLKFSLNLCSTQAWRGPGSLRWQTIPVTQWLGKIPQPRKPKVHLTASTFHWTIYMILYPDRPQLPSHRCKSLRLRLLHLPWIIPYELLAEVPLGVYAIHVSAYVQWNADVDNSFRQASMNHVFQGCRPCVQWPQKKPEVLNCRHCKRKPT